MKSLSLVVKLAERCNLNCSYCYVFNQGNESYRALPKVITPRVRERLPGFIQALHESGIERINVIFHGGEPLLLKRAEFDHLCHAIRAENPSRSISFSLQTNGVLLNAAWAEVLGRHDVEVGVSLDGDAELNSMRVYHNGSQSYGQAVAGWRLLSEANLARDRRTPTILCAITGERTARALAHFIELGVDRCDLIMPSQTAESTSSDLVEQLETALPQLFDTWWENRHRISVRSFRYIVHVMTAGVSTPDLVRDASSSKATISVDTAGRIGPDSSLLPADVSFTHDIFDTDSASAYFTSETAEELRRAEIELPDSCRSCAWAVACRAQGGVGNLVTRFRKDSRFSERTVFCSPLKKMYRTAAVRLIECGVPVHHLAGSLGVDQQALEHEVSN